MGATHDPHLRSWVESANDPHTDFPVQNLPFGVFQRASEPKGAAAIGIAIGDQIFDIASCVEWHRDEDLAAPTLNRFMASGRSRWTAIRNWAAKALQADTPGWQEHRTRYSPHLVAMSEAQMILPASIGDYTDFYASIEHATNVGKMFRPDNPLLPNYRYVPIGYHGRASSIVISGTRIARPSGQIKPPDATAPIFGPSRALDFELEVGAFIGPGNALGCPIPIVEAEEHVFGFCLVNDWSARDIQSWEYQPLGPFLAKSFATTISPWILTAEALEPYRVPARVRSEGEPSPLPYLESPENKTHGAIDITLKVSLRTRQMRDRGLESFEITKSNFSRLYWTTAQMIAHHTSNGCNLRPGDLLASGTVSGEDPGSRGCLLEMTRRGAEPLQLPTGEQRKFLEDGDEVILRAHCERPGYARIGFGECSGMISESGKSA